jgi:2-dehydro-3-deoxyphosphogluconate aldolase / (4S)-4-hydroxy-2-oxoglutarate aldolase
MAIFSRIDVALKMKETGIIPVFYHADSEICMQVVKACYDGGLRLFEFTNRGDFAHEVFEKVQKYILKEIPDMIMGAGSIIDAGTASLYIQMGANFIVSPLLNEDIAKVCNRRKILWSPGCGTLSEISKAEELGAEVVKIFPAPAVGGAEFIKAVKGPMPWTNIMPTGGVEPTEENLRQWFEAGAYCVGMGSQMISKDIINNGDFKKLTNIVRKACDTLNKIRK